MAKPDTIPSFPCASYLPSSKPEVDSVWIEPGFALGSRPYAHQQYAIAQLGIRVVVALHEPVEGEVGEWQTHGIHL